MCVSVWQREREVGKDKERKHIRKCVHSEAVYKPTICQVCVPVLGSDAEVKNTDYIWLLKSDEPNLTLAEIKRRLLLGRKVMTNLDSTFKSRDITLPTKVRLVKGMVFPVVMYGCESWTVKKAEHWRIDAFQLWCWRRLLRVPRTARRSNQSILKEINSEISLEGMMLKLKLQYFGHLMRRVDSLEKTDAGRDWRQEEKGMTEDEMSGWHHWLDGRESEWIPGVGDGQGGLVCCDSWGRKESDTTERLNWTELSLK